MENWNFQLEIWNSKLKLEFEIGSVNLNRNYIFGIGSRNWKSGTGSSNWIRIMHVTGEDWKLRVGIENQNSKLSWKFGMEIGLVN